MADGTAAGQPGEGGDTAPVFATTPGNSPLAPMPADYCPPGTGRWYVLPSGKDRGKKLFFWDATFGEGTPRATFLFVHGNPESSLTYGPTIATMRAAATGAFRVVAVDHIGFGLSDQADFEMVDMHHADNLARLVTALDLRDVTLVIHDWGGPIGTGAFLDQPERVTGLALMNTTIFPMPATGPVYTSFPVPVLLPWTYLGHVVPDRLWRFVPPMVMFSPGNPFDFVCRHVPNFAWRAMTGRLTPEETLYKRAFSPKANARASRRHVKQTRVWGHGYRYRDPRHGMQDNHDFYRRLQNDLVPEWRDRAIDAVAFFGLWDPCGKAEVQLQWLEALPRLNGHIHRFPGVGHFVEEHRFDVIGREILRLKGLLADDRG
ncbi:alpha/beta fold hydrolase [Zavarzinia compransoris]|uniref:alpha/beta fold hydrolase n=1 Tax=Zavarzinia marina TaxID=2911065 RepID=UPI001F26D7DB|nr:alpha/beta fold hydrolase [Zavarzinia marina]MCF4164893.1 alpha/beta fold hydrolase [Zavarzinia marina]